MKENKTKQKRKEKKSKNEAHQTLGQNVLQKGENLPLFHNCETPWELQHDTFSRPPTESETDIVGCAKYSKKHLPPVNKNETQKVLPNKLDNIVEYQQRAIQISNNNRPFVHFRGKAKEFSSFWGKATELGSHTGQRNLGGGVKQLS